MKKLYIFGDSFSLFNNTIKNYNKDTIEFNSHSSLSNDHLLKLVKLKLLKLIKNKVKGVNILVQLTVANRLLILNNPHSGYTKDELTGFLYYSNQLEYADKELFEEGMYFSLYPYFETKRNILVDSIYAPYSKLIHSHNEKILLKDWLLEINVLHLLAKTNGINLEYIFYPNDYDDILKTNTLKSSHIQIEGFNSIESYITKTHPSFFVSKSDIHFTDEGCRWYINFLKCRYDF
jgi:hypothetical protein